jgi:hypothetical protein
MVRLYGRAGCLAAKNDGFRPGQVANSTVGGTLAVLHCLGYA